MKNTCLAITIRATACCLGLVGAALRAIPIISGDGTEQAQIQIQDPNKALGSGLMVDATLQAIGVDPSWKPNDPSGLGAVWESFTDSGFGGSTTVVSPFGDHTATVLQVRETVNVQAGDNLWLNVWSSYTADVQIRAVTDATFGGSGYANAVAPDFSQTGKRETVDYTFQESGQFYVFFSVFQVGDGPFGLMYEGELGEGKHPDPNPIPIPPIPQVPDAGGTAFMVVAGFGLLASLKRLLG